MDNAQQESRRQPPSRGPRIEAHPKDKAIGRGKQLAKSQRGQSKLEKVKTKNKQIN